MGAAVMVMMSLAAPAMAVPDPSTCPDGQERDKDGECTDTGGGSDGSPGGTGSNIYGFSPITLVSKVENAGNSVKSKLPAKVADTLPNTGGGWMTLGVTGTALIGGRMLLVRRFST